MKDYERNSFILYKDSRILINNLNNSQRGKLLIAIFDYVCDDVKPDYKNDNLLQMCFEVIQSYLDRDEKKYIEKCKKNKENITKRWSKSRNESNTDVYDSNRTYTNDTDNDTDKDTDTDSDTDTVSDTDTETDTQKERAVFVDKQTASAAANAEPFACDLFSVKQLLLTTKRNKIKLTNEGVKFFYEEMQEKGWILYGKAITKRGIVKALRGWAKYHPEYAPEEQETDNEQECIQEEPEQENFDPTNIEMIKERLKQLYGENIIEEEGFTEEQLLCMGNELI